tara:strand:+ start:875 stop:1675 length:801 start_codon:yes stop_codon:yes gene_type:complete
MNKKILVCYLFTSFDNKQSFINFLKHYKINTAGANHSLLICFKLLNKQKILFFRNLLKDIRYIEFIDPILFNDFDFGSYKRVSERYRSHTIFFLNSHSYPLKKNWLKKLLYHYKEKTLIGTSASNESLLTSLKFKKIHKIISFLIKFIRFKKKFKTFPNPHIRTSSFLIKGADFISFIKNKKITSKEDAWFIESGLGGLTNYFKRKNYNIFVINSDGLKFTENNWKLSETYNYLKQSKSLISDKHTRKYLKLSNQKRIISSYNTWG